MKLLGSISAVLLSGLLALSFSITPASSMSEVSQTIPSSGTIRIPAVTLFKTGFETGDLSEVDLERAGGGNVTIYSEKSYSGNYSANCSGPGYGRARIHAGQSLGHLTEVNIRAYFYFATLEGYVQCIRTAGHTSVNGTKYYVYLARVVVSQGYIRLQLGMSGKNPGDWMPDPVLTEEELTANKNFELNRWYCIELRYVKGINGEARVWVDGEEVLSYLGNTSGSPDVDTEIVGLVLCNAETEIYVDDFVVADGYIGS